MARAEINKHAAEALERVSKEMREKRISRFYGIRAKERVRAAAVCLRSAATQLIEIRRRRTPDIVRQVDCDIHVAALRTYLRNRGCVRIGGGTTTERGAAERLLKEAAYVDEGTARLREKSDAVPTLPRNHTRDHEQELERRRRKQPPPPNTYWTHLLQLRGS